MDPKKHGLIEKLQGIAVILTLIGSTVGWIYQSKHQGEANSLAIKQNTARIEKLEADTEKRFDEINGAQVRAIDELRVEVRRLNDRIDRLFTQVK